MKNTHGRYLFLILSILPATCKEEAAPSIPQHAYRPPPLPESVRKELENRPQFKTIADFEQSQTLDVQVPALRPKWRLMTQIPNVEFALPGYLDFRIENQTLNQKRFPESKTPLTWERYSFIDTSLARHLKAHPEVRGTEAGVTEVYYEIYRNLTLKDYLQRRLKEDPMVFGYLKANKVNKPGIGYYLKWGDMFTYHHEFMLDRGTDTHVFHVAGPLGAIPEKSRLTDKEVEDILFSLNLKSDK
ncbi:hypothetical protein [Turneriella parva]|uniref:Uncharacterized protein n=1 Tax=Turneriella parva (strain ATCC BAA-1111 / DSM 21527 / NCTC 11395 / H) TaxID=869212 RepID=I4B9R5_TURPD|nr:hypothetical protein [Turneriella parva]AFM14022.1 hypothetical protein Turpa_3384 [Turneriella parva DSM 21527]